MGQVNIYTDGSANNHTKTKGGYGVLIDNGTIRTFAGGQYINTNSARMEIYGVLMGLKKCEPGDIVNVYLDNQYVVNSFTKRWIFSWEGKSWRDPKQDKGLRLNHDLLKQLLIQYRRLNNKVYFHWIRGHDGHEQNEICDILAKFGGSREVIIKDKEH